MGTKTFVWDPVFDCVTHELDENNNVKAEYHNEPQQYGGVLSQRRGTTTHYHHHDGLGSTRFLTDSSGNVTDTYLHDAWGNLVASTGTTVNPFKWVGKYGYYTDNTTAQVYVRARMYQPTVARWASYDPWEIGQTFNKAAYVDQNPLTLIDATGLFSIDPVKLGNWKTSLRYVKYLDDNEIGYEFEWRSVLPPEEIRKPKRTQLEAIDMQMWQYNKFTERFSTTGEVFSSRVKFFQDVSDIPNAYFESKGSNGKPLDFLDIQEFRLIKTDWCYFERKGEIRFGLNPIGTRLRTGISEQITEEVAKILFSPVQLGHFEYKCNFINPNKCKFCVEFTDVWEALKTPWGEFEKDLNFRPEIDGKRK